MGDYLNSTLKKCILGVTHAVVTGQPVSPSTEENCAVARRELEQKASSFQKSGASKAPGAQTRTYRRLIHHPNLESIRRFLRTQGHGHSPLSHPPQGSNPSPAPNKD